jgi:hypothetical protein
MMENTKKTRKDEIFDKRLKYLQEIVKKPEHENDLVLLEEIELLKLIKRYA